VEILATDKVTADLGKVRIGVSSPAFPPLHATPASVSDNGKVRMGYGAPPFQVRG